MMYRALGMALLVWFVAPSGSVAQDAPPASGPQAASAAQDTAVVELVLRREVFSYPNFTRRNPFVALTSSDAGPRFDQMRVTGILVDQSDPSRSLAVISATAGVGRSSPAQGGQQATRGQVERLRVGERWGNVRIVSIEPSRVVVDVTNFGIVERREMRLQSRSQGGS